MEGFRVIRKIKRFWQNRFVHSCIYFSIIACGFVGCRGGTQSVTFPSSTVPSIPKPRVWTLDNPPSQEIESSKISMWRARHDKWTSGTLTGYPFEGFKEEPRLYDPTPLGKLNADGVLATEQPVRLPEHSVHETEPWCDDGCVWPVENLWSLEWEDRFREWIGSKVDKDYLRDNDVPVDCADAPYALRWIFARKNFLPQGAHSTEGYIFGNWNTRFADLPTSDTWQADVRFRAALDYAMTQYIRGGSLPLDTYPISLRPSDGFLGLGTIITDKHHVRIVHRIFPERPWPVRHLSATTPAKLRTLADERLSDAPDNDGPGWGFINFSWWDYDFSRHRYLCVPDRAMPGFSIKQYDNPHTEINGGAVQFNFRGSNQPKLGRIDFLKFMLEDLTESVRVRSEAVAEAWEYYKDRPLDRDKSTKAYEDLSTPGRDKRLKRKFSEIVYISSIKGIRPQAFSDEMRKTKVPISYCGTMTLRDVYLKLKNRKMSFEPWDPPNRRWGIRDSTNPLSETENDQEKHPGI